VWKNTHSKPSGFCLIPIYNKNEFYQWKIQFSHKYVLTSILNKYEEFIFHLVCYSLRTYIPDIKKKRTYSQLSKRTGYTAQEHLATIFPVDTMTVALSISLGHLTRIL